MDDRIKRPNRISRIQRHIPNALTVLRMLCAIALLFPEPLSVSFLLIYLWAGISDMLDGFFARRWNAQSKSGARLDSAADFLLCGVLLYRLIPYFEWPIWALVWIAAIALIRLFALAVGYIRFRQIAFLHTYANKISGFLLFLFPFLLELFPWNATVGFLCAVSSVSALEELWIQLRSRALDLDRCSVFQRPVEQNPRSN